MAILEENARFQVWADFMRDSSAKQESLTSCGPMTKQELRSAVNAIDQWINDNQTSFNSALPIPARTALTPKQKAGLLVAVVLKRWEVI